MCVNCQAEHEKEMKSMRRFDDDRTYRKLGTADIEEDNG